MNLLFDENDVINKVKALTIINILQPVTKRSLIRSLDNTIDNKQMGIILSELVDAGFIAKEKGCYRVTRTGISFSISRKSNILRDVYRMKHLLRIGKQRGGDSVGR